MPRNVDPIRRSLPLAEWPELDRDAWARAQLPYDPLDPSVGYAMRWKEGTREDRETGYGYWLTWLKCTGRLDPSTPPVERATEEHVRAYLDHVKDLDLSDYTRSSRLTNLGSVLRAMEPEAKVDWILRGGHRIHSAAKPKKDKIGKLQPAEEVLKLGLDLMDAADHSRFRTPSERAVLFRDGLLIAFLIYRPVRLANLTAIEIGTQLLRNGGAWRVVYEKAVMKNGDPFDFLWPGELVQALERYLDVHRKVLLQGSKDPDTKALWIGKTGNPIGEDAVEFAIKAYTEDEFGTPINPHLFRSIAATTIATEDPENAETATVVLGHASQRTTEEFYKRVRRLDASDRFQAVLEQHPARKPRKRSKAVELPLFAEIG